ncbi:MAG TPA: cytidylate kinase-like family protein [Pirellulales bacterium]|nr:cytidylate kinase-like family protein [Pirellulales bacterium]
MAIKNSSELMGEAMLRAREHWRSPDSGDTSHIATAQRKPTTATYTITLSRESGAGGAAVARELGRLLEWPVYDRELLERIAEETGLRSELLESLDEKRSHWLVETLESLSGVGFMSGAGYARYLAETMLALASHGNCVIVGRGSTSLVPRASSLRVRLVASLEDRTERTRQRLNLSKAAALAHVRETDAHREGFVKDYLHHQVGDPHEYDLIINTSRFSISESAQMIITALHQLQKPVSEQVT